MTENFSEETYRIEQFILKEGDYDQISKLITDSILSYFSSLGAWVSPTFSKEKFIRVYGSPYLPKDTFVRAIHLPTNELVGFAGINPVLIKINENIYNAAVNPIVAVNYNHQQKNIATQMGLKLLDNTIVKVSRIPF